MPILDPITAKFYEPLTLNFEQRGSDVVARYHVAIRNVNGNVMTHLNPGSTLTQEEKAMVVAMYQRDLAQFEQLTGLELWVEPEEPEP